MSSVKKPATAAVPRNSRIQPLYHQVYVQLRYQLLGSGLDPEKPLPSEPALADRFGVSRVTIRKTLERLQGEGLIRRIHGRGTFPVPSGAPANKANIPGVLDNMLSLEPQTTARTTDWEMVELDGDGARELHCERGLRIRRIRSTAAGKPLSLTVLIVPEEFAGLLDRDAIGDQPIVHALEDKGIISARAEQTLTAISADAEASRELHVEEGSPLILMRRTMIGTDNRPVLRQESAYPPDRFEYRMTLSRQNVGPVAQWTPIA